MTITKPTLGKRGLYDFSSIQIEPPKVLANQIAAWGKENVRDEALYEANNPIYGREYEMHITVLYGIQDHPTKCLHLLEHHAPFEIELDEISMFENSNFDVVKIGINSSPLIYLNKYLKSNIQSEPTTFNYYPHITIAYVKKCSIGQINNKDYFKGIKWDVETLLFYSKDGDRTRIRLRNAIDSIQK